MKDLGQKDGSRAENPIPTQPGEPDIVTRSGESSILLSKSQPTSKVESLNKATSPYKPMIWAQTQETSANTEAAQDVIKSQKGKGRIKKIAREKGQAKNKEKQVYSPRLGSKR